MSAPLRQEIARHLQPCRNETIGVAVSGGSDSLALLYLLRDICSQVDSTLRAVTVDHGLRPNSAREAEIVSDICQTLGITHDTLLWEGWDRQGNTQAAARDARYQLIAEWALQHGIKRVALGHTLNDQAETVVMRLGRGSGVDGLAAMSHHRFAHGVIWERPMLSLSRQALRNYLVSENVRWVDDPTNEDTRFDRIRVRRALEVLEDLGVGASALAQVAQNMQQARRALDQATLRAVRSAVQVTAGALRCDWQQMQEMPSEISRRLLIAALRWLAGHTYPPRRTALEAAWHALCSSGAATLDGCLLRRRKDILWISRELHSVRGSRVPANRLWDGRWRCTGEDTWDGLEIDALGEAGLQQLPEWREANVPRDVLLVSPALWRGKQLVAAPLVKPVQPWQAVLERGEDAFFDAVFPH